MNGGIIIALIRKHAIHFTSQYRWDSQLILAPSGIPPAKQHRDWRQLKQRQKIFQSRIASINGQVCYFRKTGTTRARFPVCDCFSNVCLTHMDGTENHSRNDLIPLVRLRIRCDHSRNRMSTQDTYLRNANQVCKARKPRSYCSLMFEHLMVDCSALLKQVPNSFGFETCYGWRPFARLVVAGCHPDTA